MIRKVKYDEKTWLKGIRWYEGFVILQDGDMSVAPLGLNMIVRWWRTFWHSMKYGILKEARVVVANWPKAGIGILTKETTEKMKDIIDESHKHLRDSDHGEEWKE